MKALLILLAALLAVAVGVFLQNQISQWQSHSLVKLTVQVDRDELAVLSPEDRSKVMAKIISIINVRLGLSNLRGYEVMQQGESLLRVTIECFPTQGSCRNPEGFRQLLERRGLLEFKRVLAAGASQEALLTISNPFEEIVRDTKGLPYLVVKESLIPGLAITSARAQQAPGKNNPSYFLAVTLSDGTAEQFARLLVQGVLKARQPATKDPGDQLAIIVDGVVQSAPFIDKGLVDSARTGGWRASQKIIISGQQSFEEANELAIVLGSGALPLPITVIEGLQKE